MRPIEPVDWGAVDYAEALDRQQELFDDLVAGRDKVGWLVFCEHPHVYTLGRSGRAENLLVSEARLAELGAQMYRTGRGGDITYHGPGQIVVYPIVDLERLGLGLRDYIAALEQAVIETLARWEVSAGRVHGKTGVWCFSTLSPSTPAKAAPRKICAIGVRASRGVVMHGLALNVSTDLGWFAHINPCGMAGGAVTSMEVETGRRPAMSEVKQVLAECLRERLGIITRHAS